MIFLVIVGQEFRYPEEETEMSITVKYGIHTTVLKHVISRREMMQIKRCLGYGPDETVSKDTSLFDFGIDELSIREVPRCYPSNKQGIESYRSSLEYDLVLLVNYSRTIGGNGNLVMELTDKNIKKLQAALNNVLCQQLRLGINNNDIATWFIERLDDAFDIYLDMDPGYYIYLLNKSLYLPPNQRFEIYHESDLCEGSKRAYESVYFGNKSYTMNIYDKWNEQKKKNPLITETDSTYRLLRCERQSNQQYIKRFLPYRKVKDLLDSRNIDTMRESLKGIIKTCFGVGNYYEYSFIFNLVSDECGNIAEPFRFLLENDVVNGGRLQNHRNLDIALYKEFNKLEIAPAYIDFCTASFWSMEDDNGIKYAYYPGLFNLICSEFPDIVMRKKYNVFSVPYRDKKHDRYKVHFIVHDTIGSKGSDYYCCGKDFDECQKRMFDKLKKIHVAVSKDIGLSNQVTDDMQRFLSTIKDKSLKQEIIQYLLGSTVSTGIIY